MISKPSFKKSLVHTAVFMLLAFVCNKVNAVIPNDERNPDKPIVMQKKKESAASPQVIYRPRSKTGCVTYAFKFKDQLEFIFIEDFNEGDKNNPPLDQSIRLYRGPIDQLKKESVTNLLNYKDGGSKAFITLNGHFFAPVAATVNNKHFDEHYRFPHWYDKNKNKYYKLEPLENLEELNSSHIKQKLLHYHLITKHNIYKAIHCCVTAPFITLYKLFQ